MTLETRLSALITAIGADIKALKTSVGTPDKYNANTANVTANAADTYLPGSSIAIPQGKIKATTIYRCRFNASKTAAGVAAAVLNIRVGTAGTTADTARVSPAFQIQTAAADDGYVDLECVFRTAGATATISATGMLNHRGGGTGLVASSLGFAIAVGSSFDVTTSGLIIGVSLNPGAAAVWTINNVTSDLVNLAP